MTAAFRFWQESIPITGCFFASAPEKIRGNLQTICNSLDFGNRPVRF